MAKHEEQYEVEIRTLETNLKVEWEQKYGDRLHPEKQAKEKKEEPDKAIMSNNQNNEDIEREMGYNEKFSQVL